MTSSVILQNKYIELYKLLRNYLWSFQTVEDIAELEIACFRAIPDINDVRMKLNSVSSAANYVIREDEKIKNCIEEFRDMLNDVDTCKKILISKEV